ncbi:hypothetical protein SDC9_207316 [bioreactor metagenome]|uniref:Uncharacterized protein n=1 Tax=bioreactor metagenome TaxID=1076179 RepID=A0A645J7A2_9ZZZZ
MRGCLQPNAGFDAIRRGRDDLVHHPAGLARIARDLGHAFLVVVEFLQRHDRHVDVVLFETVEAGGVVHQDIGVEHEQFGLRCGSAAAGRLLGGGFWHVRGPLRKKSIRATGRRQALPRRDRQP